MSTRRRQALAKRTAKKLAKQLHTGPKSTCQVRTHGLFENTSSANGEHMIKAFKRRVKDHLYDLGINVEVLAIKDGDLLRVLARKVSEDTLQK